MLEFEYADLMDRPPASVRVADLPINERGFYDKEKHAIFINRKFVEFTREDQIRNDLIEISNVFASHIILHEGRHAYQYYAIDCPEVHHDQEEVQRWKENMDIYFFSLPEYHFQPVEWDAEQFAMKETSRFFQEIKDMYGWDKNYGKYYIWKTVRKLDLEKMAYKYFDRDIEHTVQFVQDKISREYQEMKELKETITDILTEADQERRELVQQEITRESNQEERE
ncbi:hypothetical protein NYE37_13720 [Thermoactinomyces sp. FSL K6-2592]|uniref:hypothetical protein n=1 Tax=Thermoactinomyces sp. FSL K6-2592 TaxID=2975347 RepID=UPI0030FB5C70